jgi:diaminopimelate epimerase
MGQPAGLRRLSIEAAGETVEASVFAIGNPQCVLLGPLPSDERFERLGPALERHPLFPQGTNVEFVQIESPDRVRIRIWERGVGPTESSGTGACASAIAAIAHGGAAKRVEVTSPGGSQTVEWEGGEVYLTGWAELVWEGTWLADV